MGVLMGAHDTDTVSSLAGRLARLNRQLEPADHARLAEASGGVALTTIVTQLFNAIDADAIEAKAREITTQPPDQPVTEADQEKAQELLVAGAARTLNGPLIELIDTIRREKEQTINHQHLDRVIRAEWDADAQTNAEALARDFSAWLQAHKDQLAALTIFFDQPYRRREVTFAMLEAVMTKLRADAPRFAPLRIWQAYRHLENYSGKSPLNELTALIALIRRACGIDARLTAFDDIKGLAGHPADDDAFQSHKHSTLRLKEWQRFDVQALTIINHQRHLPPLARDNNMPFRKEILDYATEVKMGLITAWDLYRLVRSAVKWNWKPENTMPVLYQFGRITPVPTHYKFVGVVAHVYSGAVSIEVIEGEIKVGDRIAFELDVEFEEQEVASLQIEKKPVESAPTGIKAGTETKLKRPALKDGTRVFVLQIS